MSMIHRLLAVITVLLLPGAALLAHHNTQSEFGAFDSPTIYVEGTVSRVIWGNPHIAIEFVTTGGDIPAGEKWRLASHPVQIQIDHGFAKEEFAAGDTIKLHAWKHVRGIPQVWPRAIQINDEPMKSNMRFTDMIDIAKGTFTDMNIVAAANLNGSPSARAGEQYVAKLKEMGLLDSQGNMMWPAP
jgi:hypothetical protein